MGCAVEPFGNIVQEYYIDTLNIGDPLTNPLVRFTVDVPVP